MKAVSGVTMAIVRNMFFRFYGRSLRPAYFGFRVMKTAQSDLIVILVVSITMVGVYFLRAPCIAMITCDNIDIMCGSMRLNSSKQTQNPVAASPLKNLIALRYSKFDEQFIIKHVFPSYLDSSFTVSVFPVPTGPSGAPPQQQLSAIKRLLRHLSVKGVMTRRCTLPRYSKLYFHQAFKASTSISSKVQLILVLMTLLWLSNCCRRPRDQRSLNFSLIYICQVKDSGFVRPSFITPSNISLKFTMAVIILMVETRCKRLLY